MIRKRFILIIIFFIFLFLINQKVFSSKINISQFISPNTIAFFKINTSEKSWEYFLNRKPFSNLKESNLGKWILEKLRITIELNSYEKIIFDPETDIIPILGNEICVGILPSKNNEKDNFDFIGIINIKDNERIVNIIDKIKTNLRTNGFKFEEKKYKDIKINSIILPEKIIKTNFTIIENYFLITEDLETLKSIIDSYKNNEKSLFDSSEFQKNYKLILENSNQILIYIDFKKMSKIIEVLVKKDKNFRFLEKIIKNYLKTYEKFGAGIEINKNGIKINTINNFNFKNKILKEMLNIKPIDFKQIIEVTPPEPLLFISSNQFNYWIKSIELILPQGDKSVELIKTGKKWFKVITGWDFEKDLIENSNGISGLCLYYPKESSPFNLPNILIQYEVKDINKLQKNLKKLKLDFSFLSDELKNAIIKFNQSMIYKDIKIILLEKNDFINNLLEEVGFRAGYIINNNMMIVGSNIDTLKLSIDLKTKSVKSIQTDPHFAKILEELKSKKNNLIIYFNLKQFINVLSNFVGEDRAFKELTPSLQSIEDFGLLLVNTDNGLESKILLNINMDKIDFEKVFDLLN